MRMRSVRPSTFARKISGMTMFSTLDEWCSPTQKSCEAEFFAVHGQLEVLVDALSQRLGRIMDRHDEHTESQWSERCSFFTFRN